MSNNYQTQPKRADDRQKEVLVQSCPISDVPVFYYRMDVSIHIGDDIDGCKGIRIKNLRVYFESSIADSLLFTDKQKQQLVANALYEHCANRGEEYDSTWEEIITNQGTEDEYYEGLAFKPISFKQWQDKGLSPIIIQFPQEF